MKKNILIFLIGFHSFAQTAPAGLISVSPGFYKTSTGQLWHNSLYGDNSFFRVPLFSDVTGVLSNSLLNGGNTFGGAITFGTNDAYDVNIKVNGTTRFYFAQGGIFRTLSVANTSSSNNSAITFSDGGLIATRNVADFGPVMTYNQQNMGSGATTTMVSYRYGYNSTPGADNSIYDVVKIFNNGNGWFKGTIEIDTAPTAANNAVRKVDLDAITPLYSNAVLDFPATAASSRSTALTVTITGAAINDAVIITSSVLPGANSYYIGRVTSANTISVYYENCNAASAQDPTSATFYIKVR